MIVWKLGTHDSVVWLQSFNFSFFFLFLSFLEINICHEIYSTLWSVICTRWHFLGFISLICTLYYVVDVPNVYSSILYISSVYCLVLMRVFNCITCLSKRIKIVGKKIKGSPAWILKWPHAKKKKKAWPPPTNFIPDPKGFLEMKNQEKSIRALPGTQSWPLSDNSFFSITLAWF